jgi:hypothetical protein
MPMNAQRPLKEIISAWLEVTEDQPPELGISVEDAIERAQELRRQLREGNPPASTELDEDSKDVLFALVQLVCDDPLLPSPAEAARLHRFIEQTPWEDDDFGQRDQLLDRCKEIAGAALSLQIPGRGPYSPDRAPEAAKIFDDSRAAIRLSLLSIYGMTETQADEAEDNLRAWFARFCQRGGTPRNLRRALFSGCAQLAPKLAPRPTKTQPDNLIDGSTGAFGGKPEEN